MNNVVIQLPFGIKKKKAHWGEKIFKIGKLVFSLIVYLLFNIQLHSTHSVAILCKLGFQELVSPLLCHVLIKCIHLT